MEYLSCTLLYYNDSNPFSQDPIIPLPHVKPTFLFDKNVIVKEVMNEIVNILSPPHILENSAFQLCKLENSHIEYGPLLERELSLSEQDLEWFFNGCDVGVLLRTKVSVRAATIIEMLPTMDGRELGGALLRLREIFRNDGELVQEFTIKQGLYCLRNLGSKYGMEYIIYILKVIGELMVYVDGIDAVFKDSETITWVYGLLRFQDLPIMKLALELLIIFIEYGKDLEPHSNVIIRSVSEYHQTNGGPPWSLIMKILEEQYSNNSQLVTYGLTLINKVLRELVDQDTFYDVTDCLEVQGIEDISKKVFMKSDANHEMIKQFQIYETALEAEDCECNFNNGHTCIGNRQRSNSVINFNDFRKSKRFSITQTLEIIVEDQRIKRSSVRQNSFSSDIEKEDDNFYIVSRSKSQCVIPSMDSKEKCCNITVGDTCTCGGCCCCLRKECECTECCCCCLKMQVKCAPECCAANCFESCKCQVKEKNVL